MTSGIADGEAEALARRNAVAADDGIVEADFHGDSETDDVGDRLSVSERLPLTDKLLLSKGLALTDRLSLTDRL